MTIGENRHSLLPEYIGYSDDLVHQKLDEFVLEPIAKTDRMGQALRRNIRQLKLQENGDLDQLTRQIGLSEKERAQKYQQSRTLKALPQKLTQLRRASLNAEQDPALRGEFGLQVIQFYEDSRKAINLHFGVSHDRQWREYYMEHLTGLPHRLSPEEAFQKHFNAVKNLVDFITYMGNNPDEWLKWNTRYSELTGINFWEKSSFMKDRWDQELMSFLLSRID